MSEEKRDQKSGIGKWVIGGILVIIAATLLNLNLLVYAVYTIAGILFLTRWITSRWTKFVTATRRVTRSEAEIGDVAEVFIEVRNRGNLPITWMLVEDLLTKLLASIIGGADHLFTLLIVQPLHEGVGREQGRHRNKMLQDDEMGLELEEFHVADE